MVNFKRWDSCVATWIGHGVYFKFCTASISIGLHYRKDGNKIRKYDLTISELLDLYKKHMDQKRIDELINNYQETFVLDVFKLSFGKINDIKPFNKKENKIWLNGVDEKLKYLRNEIEMHIKNGFNNCFNAISIFLSH